MVTSEKAVDAPVMGAWKADAGDENDAKPSRVAAVSPNAIFFIVFLDVSPAERLHHA